MKTFKTPAGTQLPIMDLRGKDYLQVAHRLVWFREIRPEWSIQTEIIQLAETHVIVKATILNFDGKVMATAHKREDKKDFADFMEKAETGAIGRSLALVGFGTQFTGDELDEGQRLADSPVVRPGSNHVPSVAPNPPQTARPAVPSSGARPSISPLNSESAPARVRWTPRGD